MQSSSLILSALFMITSTATDYEVFNNRPVIGILSQEIRSSSNKSYNGIYDSYIAASYVKFIEAGGARVVPIWIGQPESYYEHLMNKMNGVLFPGGSTYFTNRNGYADAGAIIYRIAKEFNKNNDYFPIWGTCLGMELLTYLEANRVEHRTDCFSQKQTIPLEFTSELSSSRMFKNAPKSVINILKTKNVTSNFHKYCITDKNLDNVNLLNKYRIISYNYDLNKMKFISALEDREMPFYAVQFHPEKNAYEWVLNKHLAHGIDAIKITQYFSNFFVNEARKNLHKFSDRQEENTALIYNYPIIFTALKNSSYFQTYMFNVLL